MRYRAAVIGCGRKGLTIDDERKCPINYCHGPAAHTRALEAMSEVDLVAVADTSPERRALAAERHPGIKIYESYDVMLADCDLDLVVIATQTPEHASATVAAARAGVGAIICEKAIATSMVEANEMIDTCARASAKLIVDHPRRYHPTYAAVEAVITSGRIGRLRAIAGTVGTGVIHNGSHFFDLFRLYCGEARAVRGSLTGDPTIDGPGFVVVEFDNGVVGTLDAQSQTEVGLALYGTDGNMTVDSIFPGYELTEYVKRVNSASPSEWFLGTECGSKRVERVYVDTADIGTNEALYRDTLQAVEHGSRQRSAGEDGARALEIALAAFASHRLRGATVSLPLDDVELRIPSR